MSQYPLVISFYTKGTIYEKEAGDLLASCQKMGLEYCIDGIDSKGSWVKNCFYKPHFILEKLLEHKRALLWVDADAVFWQRPELLLSLTKCDLAARLRYGPEWLTGTILINYTPKSIEFLKHWEEECKKGKSKAGDQYYFNKLLFKIGVDVEVAKLHPGYTYVFDETRVFKEPANIDRSEIVIIHYQASRLPKFIDKLPEIEPFLKDFTGAQQKVLRSISEVKVGALPNLFEFISHLKLDDDS